MSDDDFVVASLGKRTFPSPLGLRRYVPDEARALIDSDFLEGEGPHPQSFEMAGAREQIYFDPSKSKAAIVTCGGLCPGLNNVIRGLYYALSDNYGVPEVLGVRNGYLGLTGRGEAPIRLTAEMVASIHHQGGSILGTSRGPQDPGEMLDYLSSLGVNLLFTIGGDGTQRGSHALAKEALKRGTQLSVVGIPKTIDNDIGYCFMTFGFMSAVSEAERVIDRAHVEAKSVSRGVGLVKLMGRHSGFIAAASTIDSGEVNFTLIPEEPTELEGDSGLLAKLERRLDLRDHAVIVVAEGAGEGLVTHGATGLDASGNARLADIGLFLRDRICSHFEKLGKRVGMKYFDPSYYIRSVQANAFDSLLTERFSRHAANAALAGKTDVLVGYWNGRIVHVPLATSIAHPRTLSTDSEMWAAVRAITGQEKW